MLWDPNSQMFRFTDYSLWESQFYVGVCFQTSQSEDGPGIYWCFSLHVRSSLKLGVLRIVACLQLERLEGRRKNDVIIFCFPIFFFSNLKTQNREICVLTDQHQLALGLFLSRQTLLTLDCVLFGPTHEDKTERLDPAI